MTRPHDLVGFWAKEDDCVVEPFPVVDGLVAVPDGPGLGITLDLDAVGRYKLSG
jgi:L-alanine-DL-glutamate epimerase-like enolase superfamily enzyme